MKGKILTLTVGAMALAAIGATSAVAGQPDTKGNGLPFVDMSTAYTLIIQARPPGKCPTAGFEGSSRRTIVVEGVESPSGAGGLNNGKDSFTTNDILLTSNDTLDDFQVIDGNACDDDPAIFSLPIAVATTYQLFIKLIGKPDEETAAQLCATATKDGLAFGANTGDYYCSVTDVKVRAHGNNPYVDVTDDLLYLDATVPLFDPDWEDWLWDWEATDKAKAILKFVPVD